MKKQLLEQVKEIIFEEANNGASLTENDIALQLNISRTPVREVLGRLEEEGILIRKQRKGIVLCKPSLKEIMEIYDIRSALEGLACRLLAPMTDETTLKELKELCSKYNKAKKKGGPGSLELVKTDMDFHQFILVSCKNARLKRTVDHLHILSEAFSIAHDFELKGLDFRKQNNYSHENIIEALKKRDPERAETVIKLHIQEIKTEIINRFFGSSVSSIYPKLP